MSFMTKNTKMPEDSSPPIVLGTRGSELALVQASATEALLRAAFSDLCVERRIIRTTGDRRTDVALAEVAKVEGVFDKGVFIKELELELESGGIDIAVHSLKDMPTTLDEKFQLASVLERAAVRDVLVSKNGSDIASLPQGARVGTSSVRRAKQVAFLRPDVEILDLRGNVPTRLRKLADGDVYDAILLAEAGMQRLGYLEGETASGDEFGSVKGMPGLRVRRLPESEFFPAAGQGAIALEIRAGDERIYEFARALNHEATWQRICAEREFLRLLDAGCHTPVGVYSSLVGDVLHLKALVFPETGGEPKSGEASGTNPLEVAQALFQSLK
jgi:hydroxymethylbilane synthase